MRGASHEIEPAIAQFLVRPGDRKQQLDRGVEALLLEEAQFDRCDRREVGRRYQVGKGDAQYAQLILKPQIQPDERELESKTDRAADKRR